VVARTTRGGRCAYGIVVWGRPMGYFLLRNPSVRPAKYAFRRVTMTSWKGRSVVHLVEQVYLMVHVLKAVQRTI
jgi:hypothetical protein